MYPLPQHGETNTPLSLTTRPWSSQVSVPEVEDLAENREPGATRSGLTLPSGVGPVC